MYVHFMYYTWKLEEILFDTRKLLSSFVWTLKVQSVYLCIKKNAMNFTMLRQNCLWLKI